MCRIARLFLLQRLKGRMWGDASGFNNVEMLAVINFFPAKQGSEGNSHYSDRIIREKCICHCQELGDPI